MKIEFDGLCKVWERLLIGEIMDLILNKDKREWGWLR